MDCTLLPNIQTYSLINTYMVQEGLVASKIAKYGTTVQAQMKFQVFDPIGPVSIIQFLHAFKTVCDSNAIHKGAALLVFTSFDFKSFSLGPTAYSALRSKYYNMNVIKQYWHATHKLSIMCWKQMLRAIWQQIPTSRPWDLFNYQNMSSLQIAEALWLKTYLWPSVHMGQGTKEMVMKVFHGLACPELDLIGAAIRMNHYRNGST